eukprot:9655961-Alexandrium_andersonii.AAC.1
MLGGLRIGARVVAISRPRTPSIHIFVARFRLCARDGAERSPRELQGPLKGRPWTRAVPGSNA